MVCPCVCWSYCCRTSTAVMFCPPTVAIASALPVVELPSGEMGAMVKTIAPLISTRMPPRKILTAVLLWLRFFSTVFCASLSGNMIIEEHSESLNLNRRQNSQSARERLRDWHMLDSQQTFTYRLVQGQRRLVSTNPLA